MFVVIGTTTVDLFVTGLSAMPAAGADEFTNENFVFCDEPLRAVLGGNAGSALSLARLGASVAVSSAVGADALGALARTWYAEAGVDTAALVEAASAATSTTTVLANEQLGRRSFHHAGATAVFAPGDLDEALLRRAGVLLMSGYPLLARWRPGGARRALEAAAASGATTALDIGPAIGEPVRADELAALLPATDYLLCNGYELSACTGCASEGEGAAALHDAGARCVVVKRGAGGAAAYRAGEPAPVEAPGLAVKARFTVGAGDAFNAGLLFALRQGSTSGGEGGLRHALRFGNAVAAGVVQNARGVLGTPRRAEAEALLQKAEVHERGNAPPLP